MKKLYIVFLLAVLAGTFCILGLSARSGISSDLITSDGNAYYAWLTSVIIDRDLDFKNDFRKLYHPDPPPPVSAVCISGNVPNKCPVGMAVIELPGFLLGHIYARLTSFKTDGASLPYQIAVTGFLALFTIASFYLLYIGLLNFGVRPIIAFVFSVAALLATNLIHYIAKEPAMPHAANAALMNILVFSASVRKHRFKTDLFAGLLMGLLIATRNATITVIPLFVYLTLRNTPAIRRICVMTAGMLIMPAVNFMLFYLMHGTFVLRTYGAEGFNGGIDGLYGALFGARHGLFIYHPWYLVLIILNISAWKGTKQRAIPGLALLAFLLLWLFNGNWWCWWFGSGFGNRAFIEILIPLSLGAAITVEKMFANLTLTVRKSFVAITAVLILFNMYLWCGYLLQRYPHDGQHSIWEAYAWITRHDAPAGQPQLPGAQQ